MPKLITINTIGDENIGYLSVFESINDLVNFSIKRIYYIYGVPLDVKRGMHAHKELYQFMWCPYGSIEIVLNNSTETRSYLLDKPNKGLIVEKGFWRDMYWKHEGSVLCVAASDFYDKEDYIRDYTEYKKLVEEGYWGNANKF